MAKKLKVDPDTKQRLTEITKIAAASLALLWDELHQVEQLLEGEFDGTVSMVESLAAEPARVTDAMVWREIENCWKLGNKT